MKTKLLLTFLFFGSSSLLFSQGKKDVKKNKIKSVTIIRIENGKTINDCKNVFSKSGETIEETEYTKDGALKKITRYKLNNLDDVEEIEEYDDKNKLTEKRLIKYNSMDKKSEEEVYDSQNKLIKKHTYKYDKKNGLETERVTVDATGKTISIKQYAYEFE